MRGQTFKIASNIFEVPMEQLNESSSPDNVESWDSLRHINLVIAVEETFNIQFRPEQIGEMTSLGIIIEMVKECSAG